MLSVQKKAWALLALSLVSLAAAQDDDNNDNDNNDQESSSSSSDDSWPGTLSMVSPNAASSASLLKILPSSTFTLEWNYTSVDEYWDSITWRAYCQANGHTYDIATLGGKETSYEWDIAGAEDDQDQPWADATYTLSYCGDDGPTAVASGGQLQARAAATIMMYRPAEATPLESWKCVACHSDGNSLAPSSTLVTLLFSLVAAVWGGALLFQRMPAE